MADDHGGFRDAPDFRSLFEGAPSPYLVLDPELRIVAVSDVYLAATMTRREEILGRGLFDVFPDNPDEADATGVGNLRSSLERVLATRAPDTMAVQKYDIRRPAEEGGGWEVRYWSPCNSPILDERRQLRYIVHHVEDVTAFARLQEAQSEQAAEADELREQTDRMQAEIMRRALELQEANAGLRAASAATNEFLSRVSHELRTPLTAIVGFGELLSTREDVDPTTSRHWIGLIRSAAEHLVGLVDDVLELSRVRVGELSLSLRPVALRPLVDEVLELLGPLAAARDVRLSPVSWTAGAGYAFADDQRLRQVLINLLSNAIKYNDHGGEVRISVRPVDDHGVRLAIEDTGHGIAADLLPRLFAPFERLDEPSRGTDGTGLGLALSRGLVEAMGGTIGVESTVDVGSTFWIELAAGEALAVEAYGGDDLPVLALRAYGRERRLLYIEDTAANVLLVEEMLRRRPSIRVSSATLGALGLAAARERRPDAILLDLHLPDLPGEEVLARLQADPSTRDIPVVVLTADVTASRVEPILQSGAAGYLTKPISQRELLEVVDGLLDRPEDVAATSAPAAAERRDDAAGPRES